ncbi:Probable transposase [Serratia quinivorans]|uniref:Probable transposase n=1 Tax=Serratia quinivorans TaxID=137545 RepID=A0A380AYA0_9GAMM|nr:Probable transposase [Serratia quinivorans]
MLSSARCVLRTIKLCISAATSTSDTAYRSVLCDDGLTEPAKPTLITRVTGCDLGLSHYLIQSNGKKIANPRHLVRASRNLRRKQKALSRKIKGSVNRAKARLQVAKCHEHVANARADFQHKLSRTLVDENQAVIVETLKAANMMKKSQAGAAHCGCVVVWVRDETGIQSGAVRQTPGEN